MKLILAFLLATAVPAAAVERLSPAELLAAVEKGEAVVIDVRGSVPFELGHIRGALWMPLGLLEKKSVELPQDKLIVAYCTCKAEESSLEAARILTNIGFERVGVLVGGYPAWKDGGLPVDVVLPVEESEAVPSGRGRLAPPAAVTCRRDDLTAWDGKVTRYERGNGKTVIAIRTTYGTDETLHLSHPGTDDPSQLFLIEGSPFTERHWSRIEKGKGELQPGMSVIAWVCSSGPSLADWRPASPPSS